MAKDEFIFMEKEFENNFKELNLDIDFFLSEDGHYYPSYEACKAANRAHRERFYGPDKLDKDFKLINQNLPDPEPNFEIYTFNPKPIAIDLTEPQSLDEQLRREGFQEVGEFTVESGDWISGELRVVDKAELDPNYTPGRTFVIYQKRKRFNFSDFSIKKPKY